MIVVTENINEQTQIQKRMTKEKLSFVSAKRLLRREL